MDAVSYSKLSGKVCLKGFDAGACIFRKDAPSDFAYIVMYGSVKVGVVWNFCFSLVFEWFLFFCNTYTIKTKTLFSLTIRVSFTLST